MKKMNVTAASKSDNTMMLCASCGIAGVDEIKLKDCGCGGCDLVRYCSVYCQGDHWPKHEEKCKKRAAELKDELLFKQPEGNHFGDCPICFLPLPIDISKSVLYACCSKRICDGCDVANQIREYERRLERKCPFCRNAMPKTDKEIDELWTKRVEANDPIAIGQVGGVRYEKGDYEAAFEYLTRAAALGYVDAHNRLSVLYHNGQGVEKDEKKQLHHTEQAAIAGHPRARHNLGWFEWQNGQYDRAAKHFIIAAKLGFEASLKAVRTCYKDGHVSEEDLEAAFRAYQAAIAAMKSPQREEAAEFLAECEREGI